MMMAKRFGRIKTYQDWLCPILVENSLELLDKEIPKYKREIDFVHLCFMTDPFMHGYPEIKEMTLKIIEKLNQNGIRVTVLTKGDLPIELTDKTKYSPKNEYGITLVSLNEEFRKEFEPNTTKYEERLRALNKLHQAGLRTWVSMEPYPTPNLDKKQDIKKLLEAAKFVDKIIFGKLNYNVKSSSYKGGNGFYQKCADEVVEFCKKNDIEYHIKFGTQKVNNAKTRVIFKGEPIKRAVQMTLVQV